MEPNAKCEDEWCCFPASVFYFIDTKRRKVCSQHIPIDGQKLIPIARYPLITSPEDEALYLKRFEDVERGKWYLGQIYAMTRTELMKIFEDLDVTRNRVLHVVADFYENEKRRAQQHFHQVEICIEDYEKELSIYLLQKEMLPPKWMELANMGDTIVPVLRTKAFDNDLEIAQIIARSSSRGEIALQDHLKVCLTPQLQIRKANQLYRLAKQSADATDFIELQRALANCKESVLLRKSSEAEELELEIEARIAQKRKERETILSTLMTQDAESIKSLITICRNNIETYKTAGEDQEVEKLYWKGKQLLNPLSKSILAVGLLRECGAWYYHKGRLDYPASEQSYQRALDILAKNFPTSIEFGNTLLEFGTLYMNWNRFTEAKQKYKDAINILTSNFPKATETAAAWYHLGVLQSIMKQYSKAEKYLNDALVLFTANHQTSSSKEALAQLLEVYGITKDQRKAELLKSSYGRLFP